MKKKENKKKNVSSSRSSIREIPREFETMSQQQNRHGKGRKQSGSDGADGRPGGSDH